ncbi:sugar phosphate nucleotidyltransferase [Polyangium sp. 6x1]|uniref:sugar phosphate nucleotidyltransferase n=1 Tax=Polyangium sp. 6x1 TaxID=3042689 RepID=UPI00248215E7|nr:sugar phosphate nucleotidyltransferase [Polyangium sp. 6x1]MDI1451502.1 NTP transferase domain-containing protein [Polyangium sp. 6x1]
MPNVPSNEPLAPPARRQAVVLCGGLATRMYPRTRDVPKFLLPIAGRPFGHHLLARLAAAGYEEVVLCIGHLGDAIRTAIGDGAAFGLGVAYADEGETRLGTAGALRRALPLLGEAFLVTYGDSYLPFDYAAPLADLEAHPEARGTMSVYRNEDRWDDSNCEVGASRVLRYQKRRAGEARDPALDHIDYGAIALRREVIAELPEGPNDLAPVLSRLAAEGALRALVVTQRFYEIGSEAGFQELEAHLGARAEVST